MRAPDFWQRGRGGVASLALAPLGWVYAAINAVRIATSTPWKAPVPVICIGNLVAGGAGKTPVALDFGRRLIDQGKAVHFLSRGYGGSEPGPVRVDLSRHDAEAVGDEPLLLARLAPTWVAADRKAGCEAAAEAGAHVIIMDDGFQNPVVAKDLSVIVVDAGYGFGNGRVIPAGPLRETVNSGLGRAQALVIIGGSTEVDPTLPTNSPPVFKGSLKPSPESLALKGQRVVAFAGIGRPQKFFQTLADIGCDVRATHAFEDHHPYSPADLNRLRQQAEAEHAQLVTTEKDAARLAAPDEKSVTTIAVSLSWHDDGAIDELLKIAFKGQP